MREPDLQLLLLPPRYSCLPWCSTPQQCRRGYYSNTSGSRLCVPW